MRPDGSFKTAPHVCSYTLLLVIALLLQPALAQSSVAPALPLFPGGFIEKTTSTAVRPLLTQPQIQALLPTRGLFAFPAPYNTQAIRLTNSSDCGGTDCVTYVGYSYWRNMNNHVGSDTMLIFLSLNPGRGGSGPTLFSYNKVTDAVSVVGPLFGAGSPFGAATAEGWYFSSTQPTKIYMNDGPRMLRYDVISKQFQTVYDVTAQYGSDKMIWQMHSSDDDRVHSATLMNRNTSEMLGCLVYREDTAQFSYYPKQGAFDECNLDKSGRWLVILENLDGLYGEDNRIIDLQTGTTTVLLDQDGAAGHADTGYGVMVAVDDWNNLPNAFRLWQFGQSPLSGQLVYHNMDWSVSAPAHISYSNARSAVPFNQQYACGSGANRTNSNRANEIVCFRLDSSMDMLVVAPVMTNLDAPGGGDDYSKEPKGNLDVTGQYFIWTTNLGGSRLDAFIVKVPGQLLVGSPTDTIPPVVTLTSPAPGSSLSGTVVVTATATDDTGVAGVQFSLDGGNLQTEDTSAPYSVSWNTASTPAGGHTLTATARDAAGNRTVSAPVVVTVISGDTTAPQISSVSASSMSSSGAAIGWVTNEASNSQVEYGLTTSYGLSTVLAPAPVTSHSVLLSGLTAVTLYHYRVRSADAAGNLAWSGDLSFKTRWVKGHPLKSQSPSATLKLIAGRLSPTL